MGYLIVTAVVCFSLGFLTALVTLHLLFRDRKPTTVSAWRQVAEKGGGK